MSEDTEGGWILRPPFLADGANGWTVRLLPRLQPLTDRNGSPSYSPLRLREDGREIGAPHTLHEKIRRDGRGHYSFWNDSLYFSTPDGSDPNTNGREYEIVVAAPDSSLPLDNRIPAATTDDMFDLRRLPFVCGDVAPLVFRRTAVSWHEVLPDLDERRRLLAPVDGVETFPSPGTFAADISSVAVDQSGIRFSGPGAYNILTNFGAFKFLILPESRSPSDLLDIGRFLANNTVHSGFDVSTCTYGKFTSSLINYQNLFHKLFFSDQPLGLFCCSAAFCLCALCECLGYIDGSISPAPIAGAISRSRSMTACAGS